MKTCSSLTFFLVRFWFQVAVLVLGLSGVMLVSFSSNPATWFLSLQDMMAVPSVKVAVELVSTLIQPLTSVSGQVSCE